ncbi:ras-like protein family member 11A [Petromyzon marinus]|uniref:small monomeric GTPase n=1 Tax=Petromyzon marinus TaxID=7757 RepID=A0AAJ7WW71_PETMA|nr:ras-like protein family member 11A [Petromyzon marinus]
MRLVAAMSGPGSGANSYLAPIAEHQGGPASPETPGGTARDVRIAVLGAGGVGKTALVVRFLTKRFIGDYEANTGNLYTRHVQVDGEQLLLQMQDTPGVQVIGDTLCCHEVVSRSFLWADAFVLAFSVTDRQSFRHIRRLYECICHARGQPAAVTPSPGTGLPQGPVVAVVGNKTDLLHARQVDASEGWHLANELGCAFYREASAADSCHGVAEAFLGLFREVCKAQAAGNGARNGAGGGTGGEKRKASLVIPRPKSPNMQDLKRRFKQALTSKGKMGSSF